MLFKHGLLRYIIEIEIFFLNEKRMSFSENFSATATENSLSVNVMFTLLIIKPAWITAKWLSH